LELSQPIAKQQVGPRRIKRFDAGRADISKLSEVPVVLTQLDPPLPLETSKGSGWAHFVIDYGPEPALLWVVFMDADGACWTVPNFEVRMSYNWTLGRRKPRDVTPASPPPPDPPVRFRRPA
jgi:hypothetical protein